MTIYNVDMEEMKIRINDNFYEMPDNIRTLEEFTTWMESIIEEDDNE